MKNRSITICIMAVLGVTTLLSADFWQKKKFSEWNEKEVAKVLSDSPWARKVSAKAPGDSGGRGGRAGMDIGGGSPSEGGGGGGKRGGGKRGGGGPDIPPAPPGVPTVDIVVWWQSALPIKQAIARYRFKDEAGTSAEAAKMLGQEEQYHMLGLIGIPERVAGPKPEVLKSAAMLNVRNVPPIEPAGVLVEKCPRGTCTLLSGQRSGTRDFRAGRYRPNNRKRVLVRNHHTLFPGRAAQKQRESLFADTAIVRRGQERERSPRRARGRAGKELERRSLWPNYAA